MRQLELGPCRYADRDKALWTVLTIDGHLHQQKTIQTTMNEILSTILRSIQMPPRIEFLLLKMSRISRIDRHHLFHNTANDQRHDTRFQRRMCLKFILCDPAGAHSSLLRLIHCNLVVLEVDRLVLTQMEQTIGFKDNNLFKLPKLIYGDIKLGESN